MAVTQNFDPRFDPADGESEANVFGAWFARLGALALLVGAGFGFKYGVDEGFIGPSARVLLGIVAGIAFLFWGEWSERRGWPRLAQAVSGGGIALLYLTIWSAFQLYGLISGVEAFAALTAVAGGGGYLALRYDSQALAVMSTLGGFGNAILIREGFAQPSALFGYVVILDCAVLGLAYARAWRVLDHIAFVATWSYFVLAGTVAYLVAGLSGDQPPGGVLLGFATVYFFLFSALAVARRVGSQRRAPASETFLVVANCAVYVLATMALLPEAGTILGASAGELRGPVILVAAGVNLVAGLVIRGRDADDPVAGAALASAALLAGVLVPVQVEPFAVPAGWAALGAVMVQVARRTTLTTARLPGYVLLGVSLVYLVGLFSDPGFYSPDRVLLSPQSAAFAVHVAAFYVAAHGMRDLVRDDEQFLSGAVAVVASAMTLLWLSLEAAAYHGPLTGDRALQSLHFSLAGIWGVYAAVLLAVGIAARIAGARFLALGIFALTGLKLVLHDVWMLDTLYRTIVFMGLGGIFLACSVMYHRFRDLVVEDRTPSSA
ncbi:MAG TPA: DUF2339 domain-containing protein [Actinomycetota bacterium]|nr:DUF2339 domain-containing protein [Actinomycetota bacterium]